MIPELYPHPTGSVAFLKSKLIAESALDTLDRTHDTAEFCRIFAEFFPDEFRKYDRTQILSPLARKNMMIEFFGLVDKNLFCFDRDEWIEGCWESEEVVPSGLPIYVDVHIHNLDWWQWAFDDLPPIYRVVLKGAGVPQATLDALDETINGEEYKLFDKIDRKKLVELCGPREPLCYLAEAVDVVAHQTGNSWIDTESDILHSGYVTLPVWSDIEEIRYLAESHKEAMEIGNRMHLLHRWLKEDEARRNLDLVAEAESGKKRKRVSRFDRAVSLIEQARPTPTLIEILAEQRAQVRV